MLRRTVRILILSFIAYRAFVILYGLGVFRDNVYQHAPGPCRYPRGHDPKSGSEDITILPSGLAIVSSGFEGNGQLLYVDLNEEKEQALPFKFSGGWDAEQNDFRPLGQHIWEDPKSNVVTLAAVNHDPAKKGIEFFEVDQKTRTLKHLKTIPTPQIGMPNDLVLVSKDEFYLTEMARVPLPFMMFEFILALPTGRVFFYNGSQFQQVASGLVTANGINISPDGKYVYVAETGGHTITVYKRNEDNSLEYKYAHYMGSSALDNLNVDKSSGDIWVGAHGIMWRNMVSHGSNITAPSQVLRVKVLNGKINDVTEVFYDTGSRLHGSSVAAVYKDKLIIGTVNKQLLVCDIRYLG